MLESRPAARRNNRLVAGVVVGGMVVIAALALAYALYTQPDRRAHDVTRLEVLRRLPADTTVVASVRIAELAAPNAAETSSNIYSGSTI